MTMVGKWQVIFEKYLLAVCEIQKDGVRQET